MTTTEPKFDEMTATGRHRAWAGENAAAIVRAASSSTPPREQQRANWLDRAQPAASNSRHAAITRSLHTWSNYKSWTDKVKSNWDKDTKGGK